MKKIFTKENAAYWLGGIIVLFIICFTLLCFSEAQIPTVFTSSGIVAIISAIIGVLLTVFVTSILLDKQSEAQQKLSEEQAKAQQKLSEEQAKTQQELSDKQAKLQQELSDKQAKAQQELSDKQAKAQQELLTNQLVAESQKEKDVKIFAAKIQVFSEFTEKMWAMIGDGSKRISYEELKNLRTICFRNLVFYLNQQRVFELSKEIKELCKQIEEDIDNSDNNNSKVIAGKITCMLKDSLKDKEDDNAENVKNEKKNNLATLFNSFEKETVFEDIIPEKAEVSNQFENTEAKSQITYWHFTAFGAEQFKAFENGNWVLALIEYGERGRTNLLQQVKPNDVVFLYRRKEQGHTFGYIGAFKVTGNKVFDNPDRKSANELLKGDKEKYDMYDAIDDGATTVANLEVKPIAYNCKGVECMSPKLKTIQRMYKYEEISYLLNRFAGQDLDNNRLSGKGKLDENTEIKVLDTEYFEKIRKEIEEICKENNLS